MRLAIRSVRIDEWLGDCGKYRKAKRPTPTPNAQHQRKFEEKRSMTT